MKMFPPDPFRLPLTSQFIVWYQFELQQKRQVVMKNGSLYLFLELIQKLFQSKFCAWAQYILCALNNIMWH